MLVRVRPEFEYIFCEARYANFLNGRKFQVTQDAGFGMDEQHEYTALDKEHWFREEELEFL